MHRIHAGRALSTAFLLVACSGAPARFSVLPATATTPMGAMALSVEQTNGTCAGGRDDCAVREALSTVLFRGIPGTRQSQPMLRDESAARRANPAFFEGVLQKEEGRRFIISTSKNGENAHVVIVNLDLLRNALVREDLLRRFGY